MPPSRSRKGAGFGTPSPIAIAAIAGIALALVFAMGFSGCGDRARTNPLDPRNPRTGGRPLGFVAIAGAARVELRWQALNSTGVLGFRLERRSPGDPNFHQLGELNPPGSTGTLDNDVRNDLTSTSRLTVVLNDGSNASQPAEANARPGPELIWVADPGADFVLRLSPDGRNVVLGLSNLQTVNRIAVDPERGELWVSEPFEGRVRLFSPAGIALGTFPGFASPNALSVDYAAHAVWVANEQSGVVMRVNSLGQTEAASPSFALPTDVLAVFDSTAWVVEQAGARLRHIGRDGGVLTTTSGFVDPRRAAIDFLDGSVWVSDYSGGKVVHVGRDGQEIDTFPGFDHPYGIGVDPGRGLVWIGLDGADALSAIDRTGTERVRVEGVSRPRGLAVNARTGEVGVTAFGSGEVLLVSPSGAVLERNPSLQAPVDVVVDLGPR